MILNGGSNTTSTTRYGMTYENRTGWRYQLLDDLDDTSGDVNKQPGQTAGAATTTGQSAEYLNYQEYTTVYTFRRIA